MPRLARVLLVPVTLVLAFVPGASAQTTKPSPRIADNKPDEEENIERRLEWFFSTRRAGTASVEEMAALRAKAVLETRAAIRAQQLRRKLGTEAQQNFW